MTVDGSNPEQVAAALLEHLQAKLGAPDLAFAEAPAKLSRGMDTNIYFFRLAGDTLDEAWSRPLVLRLYTSAAQAAKAEREAAVQRFAAERGYPAVAPLLIDEAPPAFGLPVMVMPRVNGRPMLEAVSSNPLATPRLLGRLAELHAALHRLPVDGCPLPSEGSLIDRKLAAIRREPLAPGMGDALEWLEMHKGMVADEAVSLCHNDFHPLNVLIDDDGATVLDWSDVALGDRHHDLARTVVLFWIAPIAAESTAERVALRLGRGYLRWQYLRAYGRSLPIDHGRLRYWRALHAFQGWQLVAQLGDPTSEVSAVARADAVQRVPHDLDGQLQRYFWRTTRER